MAGFSVFSTRVRMRLILVGLFFFCLSAVKVQPRPEITKLLPVRESTPEQQTNNEPKPLDKFLGKLRATYNFVFRKPENTSNIERILAKDSPNPDVEALKYIWTEESTETKPENKTNIGKLSESPFYNEAKPMLVVTEQHWQNDIPAVEDAAPLGPLEIEISPKDRDVEFVTPATGLQLPVSLSRQLVEWLGSLLGVTYGVYTKLARAIHSAPDTSVE